MNEEGGTVKVEGTYTSKDVILTIEDNGPGLSVEAIENYLAPFKRTQSDQGVLQSIEETCNNIVLLFGDEYAVETEVKEGIGRRVCIKYPRYINERI